MEIWEEYSRQRNTKCKGSKVSWRIRTHRLNKTIVRCFSLIPLDLKFYLIPEWVTQVFGIQHLKVYKNTQ